ncbi:MAG TPA: type IV pilin protein [Usitatibacter sp.]|nr:type IV pilin protein [Usitatibacter sp.]
MDMVKQRGFTLIEIMITIAIIAILSAIAVPQYQDYVTRGELPEAQAGLAAYRVAMEQYYQDNRNYGPGACGAPAPAYKYFTHTCVLTNGNQGFTATATGSSGKVTGPPPFAFTINEQNARVTTSAPANWAPSLPYPCYITRKGNC